MSDAEVASETEYVWLRDVVFTAFVYRDMATPMTMGHVWEAFVKARAVQQMRPVKAAVYIKDGKFRARREDFGGCPINDVSTW